jgi:hypothetical protein
MQVARILLRAMRQDAIAHQVADVLVKGLEQAGVAEHDVQVFKDCLEKVRQSSPFVYIEDTYIMGGILLYCGILVPALLSLGMPDLPSRIAWVAFAFSSPSVVAFFLVRLLKEKNNITSYGRVHSNLAFLTEIGILVVTACLCFHVWNIIGWLFLFWALVFFLGYQYYRFSIYFTPFLGIFRRIVKGVENAPMPEKAKSDTPSGVAPAELETIAITPGGDVKE